MITFYSSFYYPCHITGPKTYIIDKNHFFKYNFLSMNFINNRSGVGNDRLYYFNDDGKLELFHIQNKLPLKNLCYFH